MSKDQKTDDVSPFALKIDSGFSSRADDIFGSLGNIEAKHEAHLKVQSTPGTGRSDASLCKEDPKEDGVISTDSRNQRPWSSSSSRPPGSHSGGGGYKRSSDVMKQEFKPPRGPPPYHGRAGSKNRLDPSRWTYYNLSDVSADDMSDRSNTAAALNFLRSRAEESATKKLKTGGEGASKMDVDDEAAEKPEKHVFRKSSRKSEEGEGDSRKSQVQIAGRPGCVVMPEYAVGQKPSRKTTKQNKDLKISKSGGDEGKKAKEIAISHLMGEEDDDEESDDDIGQFTSLSTGLRKPVARAGSDSPDSDMDHDVEMDDDITLDPLGLFFRKRTQFTTGPRGNWHNTRDDSSDENDDEEVGNKVSVIAELPDSDSTNITDLSELSSLDPKDLDLDAVD